MNSQLSFLKYLFLQKLLWFIAQILDIFKSIPRLLLTFCFKNFRPNSCCFFFYFEKLCEKNSSINFSKFFFYNSCTNSFWNSSIFHEFFQSFFTNSSSRNTSSYTSRSCSMDFFWNTATKFLNVFNNVVLYPSY